MTKKIAVQMFGHLRTFEHTYKSFFENLINPNKEDGYEIDIFIHTWDKLEANATYHNLNIDLSNKTISWYCDSTNGQVGNQLGTKDGRYNYLAFLLN